MAHFGKLKVSYTAFGSVKPKVAPYFSRARALLFTKIALFHKNHLQNYGGGL